jgi:hypothetical protein
MKSLFAALAVITLLAVAMSSGRAQSAPHDPPRFSSMSLLMQTDARKISSDLALVARDAKPGQTGRAEPACYNLKNNVDPDAAAIGYFVSNDVTNDADNLQSDVNTLEADIRNFNRDIADFVNDGVPAPAGTAATLSEIRAKISAAVTGANTAIRAMQRKVNAAYARGDSLATGPCADDGPGSAPAIPTVTY